MDNQYELTTLQDIFQKVPMHRVEVCMQELTELMMQAKGMEAAMKDLSHVTTGDAENVQVYFPETITWMDDGKGKVECNMTIETVDSP